jgi:hypothetical protein
VIPVARIFHTARSAAATRPNRYPRQSPSASQLVAIRILRVLRDLRVENAAAAVELRAARGTKVPRDACHSDACHSAVR